MASIIWFRWVGRAAILILFVVAYFGPWTFTYDGVPPPEWCAYPNFLDEQGRCAGLVRGVEILNWWGGLVPGILWAIANPIELARLARTLTIRDVALIALLSAILIINVLPFFSTLALFFREKSLPLHWFRLAVCGLASGLWLFAAVWQSNGSPRLWGVWLYIALCLAGAGCETYYLIKRRRFGRIQAAQPG